jgi:N-methylhydantoinase A
MTAGCKNLLNGGAIWLIGFVRRGTRLAFRSAEHLHGLAAERSERMSHRIGADIGGTFTDLVLVDDAGALFRIAKVLTTPERPDEAVEQGIADVLKQAGVAAAAVAHVVHGTTLFTNALIERKGARTALITTRGFRDAIEIGREHRYDMYDLFMERPTPLAPRHLRFELCERVLADGSLEEPLDPDEVLRLIETLRAKKVQAVAVCLLHSYRNPAHERTVGELLRTHAPEISCALSCEVVAEIREYDRTSTTLTNVYVQGLAGRYLKGLEERLRTLGIEGALFVMQSNGGVCDVATACRFPVRLIESGPAAGALAAAHYGRLIDCPSLLSFDMGGTTAKACLIEHGEPLIAPDFEVDRKYRFRKGSGLPVKVPVIEMIEIGAGGGSIARIDGLGRLTVGPDSAGADPGPACYGRGGDEPTVTDADLVLGYLDPEFFLGGQMRLDAAAAARAIEARIGRPLGLEPVRAAWGIHQLVNENMASAARIHAVERGKDIEKFPLFAFGGAGPVHAWRIAKILRCPRVVYPLAAGVMSAVGFLSAPLAFDFVRSLPGRLEAMDWAAVNEVLAAMEREGIEVLRRTVPSDRISFRRYGDLCYRRQGYEIRVPVPTGELGPHSRAAIRDAFEQAYGAIYGHVLPDLEIDVVSWRVVALGPRPVLHSPTAETAGTGKEGALKGSRPAYMPELEGFADVPVYDRYRLAPGDAFAGPAIVEERESTVVVGPGARARIDDTLNLIADLA